MNERNGAVAHRPRPELRFNYACSQWQPAPGRRAATRPCSQIALGRLFSYYYHCCCCCCCCCCCLKLTFGSTVMYAVSCSCTERWFLARDVNAKRGMCYGRFSAFVCLSVCMSLVQCIYIEMTKYIVLCIRLSLTRMSVRVLNLFHCSCFDSIAALTPKITKVAFVMKQRIKRPQWLLTKAKANTAAFTNMKTTGFCNAKIWPEYLTLSNSISTFASYELIPYMYLQDYWLTFKRITNTDISIIIQIKNLCHR